MTLIPRHTPKRLIIPLLFVALGANAQSIAVKNVSLDGDNIILDYSLLDTVPDRSFSVSLYISLDNFVTPVKEVRGDHGVALKPGNEKKLIWSAKQELGASYTGKVSLELRARLYVPFIFFDDFDQIKRGKPKPVTWRGGSRQSTLNFELYNKNDEKVTTIPNINAEAGHTNLYIPTDVKPGKGYHFKITDGKNKDQVVYTGRFAVKRKVPLAAMALPVIAVGGVISLLGGGDGGPGEIDGPPSPPEN